MMTDRELIEKGVKVRTLFFDADFPPMFRQFFDLESDELLDEKIEVLEALKEGKPIADIPKFYDILELYSKSEEKDGIRTEIHWD